MSKEEDVRERRCKVATMSRCFKPHAKFGKAALLLFGSFTITKNDLLW